MAGVLIDIAGWAGALLFVASYALVSTGRLQGQSAAYQALNVVGAAFLAANTLWYGALPSAALNLVWMAIGLLAWRKASFLGSRALPAETLAGGEGS